MINQQSKPTVLVVDDEEHIVEMLAEFLQEDFTVFMTTSGLKAAEILRNQSVDVIITDLKMPDLSGISLLIQSLETSPNSARILITAYADLDNVILSINEAKVSYYLTKPVDPNQLHLIAKQAAESVALRRTNQQLLTELKDHNQNLEAIIAEQTSDLRFANEELGKLHAAREQMIRMAVHDLKNPLSNVLLVLSELNYLCDSEDTKELLHIAQESSSIMQSLVNDMLSVASLKVAKEVVMQSLEPSVLLTACIQSFTPMANKKSIKITSDFSLELPSILGNSQKLREVFDNIVSNSIKYTPAHGSLKVSAHADEHNLFIYVSDTGLGMTKDDLKKVFGEFERLSAQPTGGESSTGLGLFIVKRILESHNGTVSVASDGKNKGTTFSITLPL